jgi:hypothetical protein
MCTLRTTVGVLASFAALLGSMSGCGRAAVYTRDPCAAGGAASDGAPRSCTLEECLAALRQRHDLYPLERRHLVQDCYAFHEPKNDP